MLVVHGAGKYLAKLMAHKWISCAICYINNTRFSFEEHMKSGPHLLATRPAGVKGRFVGEFELMLDGSNTGDEDTIPEVRLLLGAGGVQKYKAQ